MHPNAVPTMFVLLLPSVAGRVDVFLAMKDGRCCCDPMVFNRNCTVNPLTAQFEIAFDLVLFTFTIFPLICCFLGCSWVGGPQILSQISPRSPIWEPNRRLKAQPRPFDRRFYDNLGLLRQFRPPLQANLCANGSFIGYFAHFGVVEKCGQQYNCH